MIGDKYYLGGLSFSKDFKSVTFTEVLSCSKIEVSDNKNLVVYYKTGTTAQSLEPHLVDGVEIHEGERTLKQYRITKLKPRVIKLNTHYVEVYDLDNRVLNYLVVQDRETALQEDYRVTSYIVHHTDINDYQGRYTQLMTSSIYFKWRTLPLGEKSSFYLLNTSDSTSSFTSQGNSPLALSKYTPYRVEYSKYLLGFYDELKKALPDFHIYLDNDKLQKAAVSKPDRISIKFESLGNLKRRPYMNDPDLLDESARLSINIETADQLKYQYIKDSFQNLTLFSNIARYTVKDVHGTSWMAHVEWDEAKDGIDMKAISDDNGRFSFVLRLGCELYYYVVKDMLYNMILIIDTNYELINNGKGLSLLII